MSSFVCHQCDGADRKCFGCKGTGIQTCDYFGCTDDADTYIGGDFFCEFHAQRALGCADTREDDDGDL